MADYENATLMFQKGLAGLAQDDQNRKELALQQLKSKYDQMNKEADDYAAAFGNKDLSAPYRMQNYNSWVAIKKIVDPKTQLMPMDKWDATSEDLSNDIGVARQMLVDGKLDRAGYNKMVMGAVATAYKSAQSKDDVSNITDIEKKAMDAVQGSSQTLNTGSSTVEGRLNPLTDKVEPFQTTEGPAVSPNVPAQTFEKEYGQGGLKQQDMAIKQQNANTAAALLGQKADALDTQTAKTLLDALNSSDKSKANLALKQWLVDMDPTGAMSYFIDENKLQNDQVRKAVTDALGKKFNNGGANPKQTTTGQQQDNATAIPEGYVGIKDKTGKRFAVKKAKAASYVKQGYTLE